MATLFILMFGSIVAAVLIIKNLEKKTSSTAKNPAELNSKDTPGDTNTNQS